MIHRRAPLFTMCGLLVLAGCGSSSPAADAGPRAAMREVAAATTPKQFCGLASRGFATFLGGGNPGRCAARLPTVLDSLPHGALAVLSTRRSRGEYAVDATVRPSFPTPTTYYFVTEHGRWKLQAIGIYKPPGAGLPTPG